MLDKRCVIGRETEIGFDGENNARRMLFNIKQFLDRWPGTEPRMMLHRPGDFAPCYIDTEMLEDGVTIAWTVTRYDTERRGRGEMWIEFVNEEDDVVGLTERTPVIIRRGPNQVDPDTPIPLLPPWMQKIVALIGEIPARVNEAIQAALDSGKFKGAQGDPGPQGMPGPTGETGAAGEDGFSPEITLQRTGDGVEISVTNRDGADTQTIKDGVSPTIKVERKGSTTVLTVKDAEGEKKATIDDGQSDWNQGDAELPGYIANRTHYREDMHEILPEIVGTETEATDCWTIECRIDERMIPGRTYTVVYNGVEYACELKVADNYSVGFSPPPPYYYLGNYGNIRGGAAGGNWLTQIPATDEPFCLVIDTQTYDAQKNYYVYAYIYALDGAQSTTVAIYEDVTKRLDADYLGKNGQSGYMLTHGADGRGEWKEAPCGEVVEEIEFLSETVIAPTGSFTPLGTLLNGELITGETYTMYIDDTPYEALCIEDYDGAQYIGMYKVTGDKEWIDAAIGVASLSAGVPDNQRVIVFTEKMTSSFSLRITGPAKVAKTLDDAYLDLNIRDGNAENSLRQTGTPEESDSYQLGKDAAAFGASLAPGEASLASGKVTQAKGKWSHSEGVLSQSIGDGSHAEGFQTQSVGTYSHSEGSGTRSVGNGSHSEGGGTTANGEYSHVEGVGGSTGSNARAAHSEGVSTSAIEEGAHSEGGNTSAVGKYSHVEGNNSTALSNSSHAEGLFTVAQSAEAQHAQGRYNIRDEQGRYAHIVGNGTGDASRSNAHTVDWDGNAWYAGDVYVGGNSQDEGDKLLTVKEAKSGSGLPEPVGAHQMLVTDSEGNWTQEERLAYKTVGTVEVLPETTLIGQEADDGMMFVFDPLNAPIAEGSQYTVLWNGVEYKCVAQMFSMDGVSALVLGDIGLVTGGASTGEPFAIIDGNALGMGVSLMIYPLDGSTTATLKITGEGTTYKKISFDYLPDGVGGVESGIVLPETTLTASEDIGGAMVVTDPLNMSIKIGSQYTVLWNGAEYKCIAQEYNENGMTAPVLGDLGLMSGGTSTGEPFVIIDGSATGEGFSLMIQPLDGSTTATLFISGETIHKIPAKYLDLEWMPGMQDVGELLLPLTTLRKAGDSYSVVEFYDKLSAGMSVIVFADGERFFTSVREPQSGFFIIGDGGEVDGIDTNMPFNIAIMGANSMTIAFDTDGIHRIEMYATGNSASVPNTLPDRYFRPMTPLIVNAYSTADLDATPLEIYSAFIVGRPVYCIGKSTQYMMPKTVQSNYSDFWLFSGGYEYTTRIDANGVTHSVTEYTPVS